MVDGAGLVYNKQDDSGAAAVLRGSTDISPIMDFYKTRGTIDTKDRKPDQALSSISSAMGQAWDNDLPELQEMYNEFTAKLKDYEQTKNPQERRDKWYQVQNDQFALRTMINKSAKNRAAFEGVEKKFSGDDRFRYGDKDIEKAESWRRTSLKDRSDYPDIKAATTQSALLELSKIVKYKPDTIEDKFTSKEGPSSSKFRTIIDPAKLKESVRASIPLLPQNMQDALKVEMQGTFLANNPGVAQLPPSEQKTKYEDFIVDRVAAGLLPGYANKTKDAISLREYGQQDSFAGGSGSANKNGIWDLKRVSEDGKYFISVQPNKVSGVAVAPTDEIAVTGKELKNLFGSNTVGMNNDPVEDDKLYKINAKIDGIVLKEGEKPSIRLTPVDPVTGVLKQGVVKDVKLTNDNEQVFLKYGDEWKQFFYSKKAIADQKWKNESKAAPRTGTSTTAAPAATGKASKKNYAPQGLPPSEKPLKSLSPSERKAYEGTLTPAQKVKFIIEIRKR